MIYSPNMLKTFAECPKKYYFKYVECISVPQKPGIFEKGKELHALAHYYLRGDDVSKFQHPMWEQLRANEYFQKTYVNSEYTLSCRLSCCVSGSSQPIYPWVGGRLDALVKDDDSYYILDYKTGAVPKQNDFQVPVYMLAAQKIYTPIKFVYIGLKEGINKVIEEYDENIVLETCEKIVNAKSYPCNRDACKYCEFSKICV
jgi:hypothetical protein